MALSSFPDDIDFGPTLTGLRSGMRVFGGRYTLERELGRGGMGVIWLAGDASLERKGALKFLPPDVANDDFALADLKKETKRCLELTHPNIVRVFDWHEEEGLVAISMEFIDGASLSKLRLERAHWIFSEEEIRPWLKATCEALEYAHREAKVVHRDLGPANLMVNSVGKLKICDFGIARSLGESRARLTGDRGNDLVGAPSYMSPQHRMGMSPKPADDIYGLGATLYELLTSKPPFYTGDISAQIDAVVPPPMMERRQDLGIDDGAPIPPEWEALVASCLEKDPAKRPRSAADVWQRLEAPAIPVREPEPQKNVAPKEAAEFAKPVKQPVGRGAHPWGMLAAVALVMAGLVAGAVVWQQREGESARVAKEEVDRKVREAGERAKAAEEKAKVEMETARLAKEQAARKAMEAEESAKALAEQARAGERMEVEIADGVKMAFRWCPPGKFKMGSPFGQEGRFSTGPQHPVTMSKGYWLAETEVTQGQWKAVMGNNPSYFKGSDNLPVEKVSWDDTQDFLRKAKAPAGMGLRLPTEAEWEYACLAGATTAYGHGNRLNGKEANIDGNYPFPRGTAKGPSLAKTVDVGSYPANQWGLLDMHGNVWEWCGDWHGEYPWGEVINPSGPADGLGRVCRGGSWHGSAASCRAFDRNFGEPVSRNADLGFRPALVPSK